MKIIIKLTVFAVFLSAYGCQENHDPKLLVFSKTEGYRHESIDAGIAFIREVGISNGFQVDVTEDADDFKTSFLKKYAAVVFLSTTGDVLDPMQEAEFQRYIQAGGGYVGVHAAADTEYDWPWYGELVGAYFSGHPNNPNVREAIVRKTDHSHISTEHLEEEWSRNDEWYNYKSLNRDIIPILTLDETSYEGGTNGDYHPIAWYHEFDGGRAFYTGGGHTNESYQEDAFMTHLANGILWAMGDNKALDYNRPTVRPEENRFVKEELDSYFNEPMELDLLPDGKVIFVERKGAIKVYDPESESTREVAKLEVYSGQEDGLMGLAIDPDYESNKHIFLCYSIPEQTEQRISRFEFDLDKENVLSNEVVILSVPTQRDECCHSAGSLEIDHNGYLWASFGDDTNPHQSDGRAPIDERDGRGPFDAQKSSSNTNDLRGGIIRIDVQEDGSYQIPDGNLFPKDGSKGRPEIYVMGCRNPFRFSIDPENNYLYWGDVGPDAREDKSARGPRGYDEVNQAKGPGFFGWPYFIANNKPYNDYDFTTEKAGDLFDPLKPVNNSPNNTGVKELPPAQPAMIYYPYANSKEFPLMGSGGRNAMAGPVYHYDRYDSNNRFPEYYDDKLLSYDWMRGQIYAVTFDDNGDYKSMEYFLPNMKWNNLMDVVMGPEGDLYTLEYGTGWFTANQNAVLSHLKYVPGNRVPHANYTVNKTAGAIPLVVDFDGSSSTDTDGDALEYNWDFGDGNTASGLKVSHEYTTVGEYSPVLTVVDKEGETASHRIKLLVGNTPPEISIDISGNKDFYFESKGLDYKVIATDVEDGVIAPNDIGVTVDYLEMGHDITSIAQGHMALSQVKASHPGIDAISKSDCVSCHKLDGTSIGPSYTDVSNKYKNERKNKLRIYLSEKIIQGGSGVWGETAMAAHPDIPEDDVRAIADYIIEIARSKPEVALPSSGVEKLSIPTGKAKGGKFIIMASYTDKGGEDVEALRSFKNVILRSPDISAVDYVSVENATKFTVTSDVVPDIEEDFDIVMINEGAVINYGKMDLTNVTSLALIGAAPSDFAAGGTLSVHLDDVNSTPLFSTELNTSTSLGITRNMKHSINVSGEHELIIKCKSAKEGERVGFLTKVILEAD